MKKLLGSINYIHLMCLIIGNFLVAFSVANFILPYGLITGGMSGVAIITHSLFGFNEQIVITVLLISLFLIGFILLGKKFALKTAFSTFYYPIALEICLRYPINVQTDQILLIAIFAGIITGIGVGLVFRVGASTGGLDIPALVASKLFGFRPDIMVAITDGLIILGGMFVVNIEHDLLGMVAVACSSTAINKMMLVGSPNRINVMIISNLHKEVLADIHGTIERGTTILEAHGGYTSQPRPVIMTVIDKRQLSELTKCVNAIDLEAFVIVNEVHEVKGRGFTFK